jgi:RsmE family RNA methyltransferase
LCPHFAPESESLLSSDLSEQKSIFKNLEICFPDIRLKHLRKILKARPGCSFKAGVINGPSGYIKITHITKERALFDFVVNSSGNQTKTYWPQISGSQISGSQISGPKISGPQIFVCDEPAPLCAVIGAVRPPVVKRLLKDLTVFNIRAIYFCATDLSDKSYLDSHSFRPEDIRMHLIQGAQQGGITKIPRVQCFGSVDALIEAEDEIFNNIVFDNISPEYDYLTHLSGPARKRDFKKRTTRLFFGPERGWSQRERELFIKKSFPLVGMGPWIMRTETAVISGAAVFLMNLGL